MIRIRTIAYFLTVCIHVNPASVVFFSQRIAVCIKIVHILIRLLTNQAACFVHPSVNSAMLGTFIGARSEINHRVTVHRIGRPKLSPDHSYPVIAVYCMMMVRPLYVPETGSGSARGPPSSWLPLSWRPSRWKRWIPSPTGQGLAEAAGKGQRAAAKATTVQTVGMRLIGAGLLSFVPLPITDFTGFFDHNLSRRGRFIINHNLSFSNKCNIFIGYLPHCFSIDSKYTIHAPALGQPHTK